MCEISASNFKVGVNLTARIIKNLNIDLIVKEYPESPKFISFEVLESVALDDKADIVVDKLLEIRNAGFTLEIDDFNRHTSILGLVNLNLISLKLIDGSRPTFILIPKQGNYLNR